MRKAKYGPANYGTSHVLHSILGWRAAATASNAKAITATTATTTFIHGFSLSIIYWRGRWPRRIIVVVIIIVAITIELTRLWRSGRTKISFSLVHGYVWVVVVARIGTETIVVSTAIVYEIIWLESTAGMQWWRRRWR